jgi:hypothetical protein
MADTEHYFVKLPAIIGLGANDGGNALQEVKQALWNHTNNIYLSELDCMHILLLFHGWHSQNQQSGVDTLRLALKYRYVSAKAHFALSETKGLALPSVRQLLLHRTWEGIEMCVGRIKKAKLDFNEKEFRIDLMAARFEIEAKWRVGTGA